IFCVLTCLSATATASAQEATPNQPAGEMQHDHAHMATNAWEVMTDGALFVGFNHQGGARGGNDFVGPNWVMTMASRNTSRGQIRLTGMFSLDAATLGRKGYREIFQVGETLDGRPLVDRQHPHDFFMQLAASWRIPIGSASGVTLAGAAVGEPALGPPAFMHR